MTLSVVQHVEHMLKALPVGDSRLVVAVSGGADSVALLRVLCDLLPRARLLAAHLNHTLRGPDSDADAEWVRGLCEELRVPLRLQVTDVARRSAETGTGLEEAARAARYEFFIQTAREHQAPWVAVAHTADDQAETVLHHILRGTGLAGLRGIPLHRPLADGVTLIRPVLNVSRAALHAELARRGQSFRTDASNSDPSFTRNRIRSQLLPVLQQDYNPRVVERLVQLSAQAAAAQEALSHWAAQQMESSLVSATRGEIRLSMAVLKTLPRHLVREVFVEIWKRQNWPRQAMTFDHWDQLASLVLENHRGLTLPGCIQAQRKKTDLILHRPQISAEESNH